MAPSIIVHLQIFKRTQLPHFSTDLDETGIKIRGLLITRVAVPFKYKKKYKYKTKFLSLKL